MNDLAKILILAALASGSASAAWEALPTTAPAPKDNPTTEAKVELGKMQVAE